MLNLFTFEQSNIKKIIIITIILIFTDLSYLYLIKNLFQEQIIKIQNQKMQFRLIGAIICYLLLVFGLYYFIIKPKRSVNDAFLLGIVIYSVYELTNLAILSKWSVFTVLIDTLWGGVLFATTTYLVRALSRF